MASSYITDPLTLTVHANFGLADDMYFCKKNFFFLLMCAGRLETHIDNIEDCKRLARQCQLPELIKEIEDAYKKQSSFGELMHSYK